MSGRTCRSGGEPQLARAATQIYGFAGSEAAMYFE